MKDDTIAVKMSIVEANALLRLITAANTREFNAGKADRKASTDVADRIMALMREPNTRRRTKMDINATLAELQQLAKRILGGMELNPDFVSDADRMAELFKALDEWITEGGFPPSAWAK